MLQELVARTGTTAWAIASMLFFVVIWLAIAVRVFRARPEEMEARARLALEGDEGTNAAGSRQPPVDGPAAHRHERRGSNA